MKGIVSSSFDRLIALGFAGTDTSAPCQMKKGLKPKKFDWIKITIYYLRLF